MASVLLVGAFGQGNPGDEALLRAFLDRLDARAIATSSDPEGTRNDHGCSAVATSDIAGILRAVASVDAVVFAGGTIFKLLHPSTGRPPRDLMRKALVLAAGARALRRPIAMVGVGAGRLDSAGDRRLVRAVCRHAQLLVLRDEESAVVLTECGVPAPIRIAADPAWVVFDGTRPAPVVQRDRTVIVALSHHAATDDLSGYLAQALHPLRPLGLRVVLQPWQASGPDVTLAQRTAELLDGPAAVTSPPATLADAAERFARANVVVGLRHHALMAAAAAGTPFVAYAHEPKLRALARRMYQPAVFGTEPSLLTGEILERIDAPGPPWPDVAEQIARADESFRLLRVVVARGETDETERVDALPFGP